jgi:hypothetical protein
VSVNGTAIKAAASAKRRRGLVRGMTLVSWYEVGQR